ncbi:hypothetical protein F5X68DRAFT_66118 [Plectosphaerella plurivora]|uniref:Secreted protein n=1 Tax=Plectosphaerella plurivora TaxID=936078 RepID=A0A9P8VIN6_9PEZI|nr:hypothetical protein F5X68DRAFT_66118 [Plectosphaerella plurivora]
MTTALLTIRSFAFLGWFQANKVWTGGGIDELLVVRTSRYPSRVTWSAGVLPQQGVPGRLFIFFLKCFTKGTGQSI